jgi:imidazolonepropionase-like amidohydrolase
MFARPIYTDRTVEFKCGWEADLVVLRANPLESLENTERIEMVLKAGKIYTPLERMP